MKHYISDSEGLHLHEGLSFEKSETISKNLTTMAGDGDWKYLHGVKLFVGTDGIVIKGPDLFIGRQYDDLKNLNYADTFNVMRSIMRATGATNKSTDPDDPEGIKGRPDLKEVEAELEKTLKIRKAEKANQFVADPLFKVSAE